MGAIDQRRLAYTDHRPPVFAVCFVESIYVSTKVRAGLTQMERFELALSMKHSPLATLKYVRAFKNKTDDAAANNELPRNY